MQHMRRKTEEGLDPSAKGEYSLLILKIASDSHGPAGSGARNDKERTEI